MESGKRNGGWLQVNNTVVPYLERRASNGAIARYAPLDVIRYGAGLLRDVHVNTSDATEQECQLLTEQCAVVKLNFQFCQLDGLALVDVRSVWSMCQGVIVRELPDQNPFEHTRVVSEEAMSKLTPSSHTELSLLGTDSEKPDVLEKRTESNIQKEPPTGAMVNLTQMRPGCGDDISKPHASFPDHLEKAQSEPLDLSIKSTSIQIRPRVRSSLAVPTASQRSVVHVAPVRLFGRKIPCIVKKGVQYVLVETLRRAYFPQCSLRAFMFMVNRSISPFVYDLEQEDIDAIMSVSKNPTSLSKSSKVISMHDAGKILPMFRSFLKKVSQQRQERKYVRPGSNGSPVEQSNALGAGIQLAAGTGYMAPPAVPETMHPPISVEQIQNSQDPDCILMSEFHTPMGLIQCGDIFSDKHEMKRGAMSAIAGQPDPGYGVPAGTHLVPGSAGNASGLTTSSPGVSSKRGRQRSLKAALARIQHSKDSAS